MEDIFAHFGDIFGGGSYGGFGGFGSAAGGAPRRRRQPKGSDLRIKVKTYSERAGHRCDKETEDSSFRAVSALQRHRSQGRHCVPEHASAVMVRVSLSICSRHSSVRCSLLRHVPTVRVKGRPSPRNVSIATARGIVRQEEVVEFTIPAGVSDGMTPSLRERQCRTPWRCKRRFARGNRGDSRS